MDDGKMVCVGAIAGAFGVRGEVRLKSFCADPAAIGDYSPLKTEDGRNMSVQVTRAIKAGFAARIDGVTTKDAADALRSTRLYVDRDQFPELEEDEYYYSDLLGIPVFDTGGEEIGKVKAVLDHGAGDLLEVQLKGSPKTALLPFTREIIPTVDVASRRIVADPPEGLLE